MTSVVTMTIRTAAKGRGADKGLAVEPIPAPTPAKISHLAPRNHPDADRQAVGARYGDTERVRLLPDDGYYDQRRRQFQRE